MSNYRPVRVIYAEHDMEWEGLFLGFGTDYKLFGAHQSGQITVAIIEQEDGMVVTEELNRIQFLK